MKLKQSSSRANQNIEREPPCIMKKQRGKRQFQEEKARRLTVSEDHKTILQAQREREESIETELCEISKNDAVSVNECVVEQQKNPNCLGGVWENDDLACKEELYMDDIISDCSSCQETAFSELQPEKSVGDSVPSQISSLLLQLGQHFSLLSLLLETRKSSALLESYQEKPIPELYCATTEHGDLILQQRSQIVHWIIEARDFYIGNNMYRKCKVVHCHGMVGAGGPYLPIFLAHHPQLHVETPFPSSHALYLMVVHVGTNENDLHECIKEGAAVLSDNDSFTSNYLTMVVTGTGVVAAVYELAV
ncbi:hypothetical protein NC653_021265 [Populus alba x Populus x berolinensis]|uniref:Uncharacterized protein n=1 Tax=Populus alba x Populus x berolinensis TaxID=444605 RepID=A0AAD6QDF4_9ROSI|nr:hypothetical protein NC653_021265 [Populus alba x Populus x berolinensis]